MSDKSFPISEERKKKSFHSTWQSFKITPNDYAIVCYDNLFIISFIVVIVDAPSDPDETGW